jgi:hypothetical protein
MVVALGWRKTEGPEHNVETLRREEDRKIVYFNVKTPLHRAFIFLLLYFWLWYAEA